MEHWLPIAAAVFLIGMVLYGHHRGFLRQGVSVGALVLTICLVKIVTPSVTEFIESNPQIHSRAAEIILTISGWNESGKDNIQAPASQRTVIEGLKLPQFIKDMLIENNNSEFYNILGVEQFTEYITACLADMAIHVVCSVLIFILSYVLIRFLIYWLDLIARLPIICGLNQLAGAFLGLAQGLLILWIAGMVLKFFEAAPIGLILEQQIRASSWLSFLYQYNPLDFLFSGFIRGNF